MIEYTATCLFGLEGLLGQEIDKLGYHRTETMDGRITFEGDMHAAAVCNIGLRYAERLYLHLASFEATTFDELFVGCAGIAWEDFIGKNDQFPVKGHAIKSKLFSVPDCQKIIKKSVAKRLGEHYGLNILPETGIKYQIEFFIFKDRASLMIDLSGIPLHKRGYRPETVTAPLRETLAAGLAAFARPRDDVLFWDPFCGSGTIAIEVAMQMKNIAPGLNRSFAAEAMPQFGKPMFDDARKAARGAIKTDTTFEAFASDIDENCVRVAEESAKRVGVADVVKCFQMDAMKIEKGGRRGTVVTNPPYGERLMDPAAAEKLYRDMGVNFARLDMWQIYVITSNESFQRLYGRRADKIRKLYNGMIPCLYYQFFKSPVKR